MTTKMLSLHSGPAVLLHHIAQEIDFEETINRLLRWDPSRYTLWPVAQIKALAINTLCGRDPLYEVQDSYEDQDDWEQIPYVADSAFVPKRNLRYMGRLKWWMAVT